jgi:hypothetical protein
MVLVLVRSRSPVLAGLVALQVLFFAIRYLPRHPLARRWLLRVHPRGLPWSHHPGIDAAQTLWQRLEIATPARASLEEIARFEREYAVALPDDVRAYFALVNGTTGGEHGQDDPFMVSFWPLSQVRTFAETHIRADDAASQTFAFADRSIRMTVYGIRLSADSRAAAPVVASGPLGCVQIAPSLGEFLWRYATGDWRVLNPDVEVVVDADGIGARFDAVVTPSMSWAALEVLAIDVARLEDGTVRATWQLTADVPVSPMHSLLVPVTLAAQPNELAASLMRLPEFDLTALQAARVAEEREEEGCFLCWTHPSLDRSVVAGSLALASVPNVVFEAEAAAEVGNSSPMEIRPPAFVQLTPAPSIDGFFLAVFAIIFGAIYLWDSLMDLGAWLR